MSLRADQLVVFQAVLTENRIRLLWRHSIKLRSRVKCIWRHYVCLTVRRLRRRCDADRIRPSRIGRILDSADHYVFLTINANG